MTLLKFKQTEIGKIPEDWEEIELEILGKIKTGKGTEKLSTGKYKLLGANGLIGFTNDFLEDSSLIYTGRVGTIGQINFQEKEKVWLSDNTIYFTCKDEFLLKYIYYALKKNFGYLNVGSTQPLIKQSDFKKLNIQIPKNEKEMHSIASILSSLDAKIELNNKMNKTLETIGQTLFKKWFVDERKGEWGEGKLGDYAESVSGCSYTSKGLNPSENALVTLKSVGVDGFKQDGFKEYTGEYKDKHVVKDGDIVVAHTDLTQDRIILGKPVIVRDFGKYKEMVASMDLSIVRPTKLINKPFLYFLLNSNIFHGYAQGHANGTTVIHLSRKAIPEFTFFIPDKDLLEKFKEISDNLFNKIRINDLQNQTLAQIRDALLPKLMSGEIRVK